MITGKHVIDYVKNYLKGKNITYEEDYLDESESDLDVSFSFELYDINYEVQIYKHYIHISIDTVCWDIGYNDNTYYVFEDTVSTKPVTESYSSNNIAWDVCLEDTLNNMLEAGMKHVKAKNIVEHIISNALDNCDELGLDTDCFYNMVLEKINKKNKPDYGIKESHPF